MSTGSRNSSDRDQNESPNTCETTKSSPSKKGTKIRIKNKPSFNNDSGIVPDSSDCHGTIGRHQAGVVNDALELDTTSAGETGHISEDGRSKTRPGLSRKRISFKDEVEAKQIAGVLPKGDEVAVPVSGVSDTTKSQQPATSFLSNMAAADPPTNQDEVNCAENALFIASNGNQPTSEAATCLGIGSSNQKRRRKYGYSSGSYNSASYVFGIKLIQRIDLLWFLKQSLDSRSLPIFVRRAWRGQVCRRPGTNYKEPFVEIKYLLYLLTKRHKQLSL